MNLSYLFAEDSIASRDVASRTVESTEMHAPSEFTDQVTMEDRSALIYSKPSANDHSAISSSRAANAIASGRCRRRHMNSASPIDMEAAKKRGNAYGLYCQTNQCHTFTEGCPYRSVLI